MRKGPPVIVLAIAVITGIVAGCSPDSDEHGSAMNKPVGHAEDKVSTGVEHDGADSRSIPAQNPLAETSWRLVKIMSMDDSEYVPDDSDLYTLTFDADGSMSVTADCNRGTGSWSSESPGQLQFGVIAATRAMCAPDSLHDRYMSQFEWVRSYVLEDGHLYLATMADGSIIEFEPVTDEPVVATVLGEDVRADSAAEMQDKILTRLFGEYAAEHDVQARPAEIQAWIDNLHDAKKRDRAENEARLAEIAGRLDAEELSTIDRESLEAEAQSIANLLDTLDEGSDLTPAEKTELGAMEKAMARSIIERWKLNRALYEEYGGRVIFQQLGPEPLDAYRKFLEERQAEGDFVILDPDFEPPFWRYFTDDSIHSFMEPGSEAEAQAFEIPPWESFQTGG